MAFDVFPWQKTIWHYLYQRNCEQNVPHALLFSGSEGLGKEQLATAFAALLLCRNAVNGACGSCSDCELFKTGNHPDIKIIAPEESGQVIKVEQVRALTEFCNQTPKRGKYQVVIITSAEALNKHAANALLKTLEEPPGQVCIMLLTANSLLLPATIRSRCQLLNLKASQDIAIAWLKEQAVSKGITDLSLALRIADYAPLKALSYLQQDLLKQFKTWLTDFKKLLRDEIAPSDLALANLNQDVATMVHIISLLLLDLCRLKVGVKPCYFNEVDIKDKTWQGLAQSIALPELLKLVAKFHEARLLLTTSVNVQLLLEDLFITSYQVAKL